MQQEKQGESGSLRKSSKYANAVNSSALMKSFDSPDNLIGKLKKLKPLHLANPHVALVK